MTGPLETVIAGVLGEHHLDTDGDRFFCTCLHEYGEAGRFLGTPESIEAAMDAHVTAEIAKALAAETRIQWAVRFDGRTIRQNEPIARCYAGQYDDVALLSRTVTTIPTLVSDWVEVQP